MPAKKPREVTQAQWMAEGVRRFGKDWKKWVAVCPVCKVKTVFHEWEDIGASEGEVAFSCIGRHVDNARSAMFGKGKGPCDYTGGGLFQLNPVHVTSDDDGTVRQCFDFAEVKGTESWSDLNHES